MRPQIIASIEEARQHGDLKENAEYHAAREQHGFNEGRIQEIESKLGSAQVIDPTQVAANGKVIFGATVELSDADSGAEQTWQIVGEDEADVKEGRISLNSPIRSEEHTSELQSLMRNSYAVFCLTKKN